jgi:hypothetical protein
MLESLQQSPAVDTFWRVTVPQIEPSLVSGLVVVKASGSGQMGIRMSEPKKSAVDLTKQPSSFSTQMHAPAIWVALGRTVAIFRFLEDTLGKAIFAYTGMGKIPEEQSDEAEENRTLILQHENAVSESFSSLVATYRKAVRDHDGATIENLSYLLDHLKEAEKLRNVPCHESWKKKPDTERLSRNVCGMIA